MQGQLPKMAPNSATTLDIIEEILRRFKKKKNGGVPKLKMKPAFKLLTLTAWPIS